MAVSGLSFMLDALARFAMMTVVGISASADIRKFAPITADSSVSREPFEYESPAQGKEYRHGYRVNPLAAQNIAERITEIG